jgi:hypothetical protein
MIFLVIFGVTSISNVIEIVTVFMSVLNVYNRIYKGCFQGVSL